MSSYESTGKTVQEAISDGLAKLGLSIAEVQVDILDEGSKGLFGLFGSKMARVRLTVKEEAEGRDTSSIFADSLRTYDAGSSRESRPARPKPAARRPKAEAKPDAQPAAPKAEAEPARKPAARPAEEAAAPKASKAPRPARKPREKAPAVPATPAEQKDPATLEGQVQTFLQELTRLMNVPVSVHVLTDEEGNIRVTMEGDAQGILIGRRGETLDALQYLTGLHLNRGKDDYTRVTLDSEGYRAKREDALIRLANRMANRALRTGRRVSLEPMNPYERRILHSALQDHEGIATHSEGEEPNRYVVITINQDAPPQGGDADEAPDEQG
ncbi:MAG: protein jag [Clostridiales bacterium]|nr:protein jag [Clostridiales bacterium]